MCQRCVDALVQIGVPEAVANAFGDMNDQQYPVEAPTAVVPDNSDYMRRVECLKIAIGTRGSNDGTADMIRRGAAFYSFATRGAKTDD